MDIRRLYKRVKHLRSIGLKNEKDYDYIEAFNLLVNEGLELLNTMAEIGERENALRVTEEALLNMQIEDEGWVDTKATAIVQSASLGLDKKQLAQWCADLAIPDNDG